MGINQFRAYALQTLCEAHMWKEGDEENFSLMGWSYKVKKEGGLFHLYCAGSHKKEGGFSRHDGFNTMGELFQSIFNGRYISYN